MNIVVIGAQWGDEGKGKIVDFLASEADVIVRFSGGANAGHTIVHAGSTYKLHLVPSGIVYPNTTVVLGSGMVIDPTALFQELEELESAGIAWENRVLISDRAHIVLPNYRDEDVERDSKRNHPIGTTGRGIGIAYSHKSLRDGVRLADIELPELIDELKESDQAYLAEYRERLLSMSVDISTFMQHAGSKSVLLEGAQGTLLDLDLGTYPYVSSGSSNAAGAAVGAGVGPRALDHVLGVFKAYSTRVGNGPFPSEFDPKREGELEDLVRDIGREYGVTTGRPRRCGYLDLIALRYACWTNSIDGLALTHLDVYDSLDEVRVCVAYETDRETLDFFPASARTLTEAKPVTKTFPGWKTPLTSVESYDDLPENARTYIDFIERFVGVPVTIVSVGYEREHTIVRKSPWTT